MGGIGAVLTEKRWLGVAEGGYSDSGSGRVAVKKEEKKNVLIRKLTNLTNKTPQYYQKSHIY
jgi:hypothetical protein